MLLLPALSVRLKSSSTADPLSKGNSCLKGAGGEGGGHRERERETDRQRDTEGERQREGLELKVSTADSTEGNKSSNVLPF